jgi:streptogramin lyase
MLENDNGTFWITSKGRGLYLFNPINTRKKFTSFPCEHNDMEGLMKDKNGNLWIIVSGGLEFFDTEKNSFTFFGVKEEFPAKSTWILLSFWQRLRLCRRQWLLLRFIPEKIRFNWHLRK